MAYQTHRKKIMPIYHKIFQKTEEKEGMLTTHFLEARITLIWKPNKRITYLSWTWTRTYLSQSNIFYDTQQNISRLNSICKMTSGASSKNASLSKIWKSINVISALTEWGENHMIILTEAANNSAGTIL